MRSILPIALAALSAVALVTLRMDRGLASSHLVNDPVLQSVSNAQLMPPEMPILSNRPAMVWWHTHRTVVRTPHWDTLPDDFYGMSLAEFPEFVQKHGTVAIAWFHPNPRPYMVPLESLAAHSKLMITQHGNTKMLVAMPKED